MSDKPLWKPAWGPDMSGPVRTLVTGELG
jgi:hypothetical protein